MFDKFWHKTLHRPYKLSVSYDVGKGKSLVFLHGLGQSGLKWTPLVERLDTRRWRAVAPDLLGFGQSPKPDWNSYDVREHARMVVYTLRRLKVDAPITLVGHSMGCLVATHIAATHPQLIKRLVLYQPPLFADDPVYRRHQRRRGRYFALYTYIANHPQLAFLKHQMLWRMMRRITGLYLNEDDWVSFERSLRNTIMGQTAYDELRNIAIRTDIIHGRLDVIVTRAQLAKMFAHNRHITLHLTNDMHDISSKAALYIMRLLSIKPAKTGRY